MALFEAARPPDCSHSQTLNNGHLGLLPDELFIDLTTLTDVRL